jgi:hypothetical protein
VVARVLLEGHLRGIQVRAGLQQELHLVHRGAPRGGISRAVAFGPPCHHLTFQTAAHRIHQRMHAGRGRVEQVARAPAHLVGGVGRVAVEGPPIQLDHLGGKGPGGKQEQQAQDRTHGGRAFGKRTYAMTGNM